MHEEEGRSAKRGEIGDGSLNRSICTFSTENTKRREGTQGREGHDIASLPLSTPLPSPPSAAMSLQGARALEPDISCHSHVNLHGAEDETREREGPVAVCSAIFLPQTRRRVAD